MHRARCAAAVFIATSVLAVSCAPRPGPVAPEAAPEAGLVVLPPDYDSSRAYPVVVLLPPTGNTADALLQIYLSDVGLGRLHDQPADRQLGALWPSLVPLQDSGRGRLDFIVVMARGHGSASDYGSPTAWARTIERYERRVLSDLRSLTLARRVDTTRIVVAGFSMGGDLAWALALRNPGVLHGAIVMASRATYRPSPDDLRAMVRTGARFFLTMGEGDEGIRRRLARAAAADLERWGVVYRFRMIPDVRHAPAPLSIFSEALEFVLSR